MIDTMGTATRCLSALVMAVADRAPGGGIVTAAVDGALGGGVVARGMDGAPGDGAMAAVVSHGAVHAAVTGPGVGSGAAGGAPVFAAMVCAGAAAWLLSGQDPGARRARLLLGGGAPMPAGPLWRRAVVVARARMRPEWWCLVAGALIALLGASPLPLALGALGVSLVRRMLRAEAERRARERRADEVIALCAALAGEVRAGRQPGQALLTAARDTGGLGTAQAQVLAAARFGGDVPQALAVAAREPGAEGLSGLVACWSLVVDRGAALAAGLERLEGALRAERGQRAELRALLAGARSTALMLAGLPVLGLLLGTALGADPLHVLLHTAPGLGCLLVGGVLEAVGLWWALRIVRGGEGA